MTPELSICIPTYNRVSYLKELLPGLVSQIDAVADGKIELVVSDNASTDATADYLRSIERPYLHWWTNEKNIGGDRNFLKCVREARGEYVWLLGDDDLVSPDSVATIMDRLVQCSPDLLIAGPKDSAAVEYASYRDFLVERCQKNARDALAHTLISANVFRREVFDMAFAERTLYTQYAHMFGLVKDLNGKVVVSKAFVGTRPVRAEFAKYPSFLCVKQALYFRYLARRFSVPRFNWFALKNASNLPLEFGSRIKFYLLKAWRSIKRVP